MVTIECHKDCLLCQNNIGEIALLPITEDEKILIDHMYEIHDLMTLKDWLRILVIETRKEKEKKDLYQFGRC